MPIIYIHGVNTRDRAPFENEIRKYLRRYIAPAISDQPKTVMIEDAFWGDKAVQFAWGGISRPKSQLLGQGAAGPTPDVVDVERALVTAEISEQISNWPAGTGTPPASVLISGSAPPTSGGAALNLRDLNEDELSDFLSGLIARTVTDTTERAAMIMAADDVARDPTVRQQLRTESSADKQVQLLLAALQQEVIKDQPLLGQGVPQWLAKLGDRTGEALRRSVGFPAYTASVALAELRRPLNDVVSVFIGDVFHYLRNRGEKTNPGVVPQRLLDKLVAAQKNSSERSDEPIVVLSHSMGGQIVYDAVSHFLPADPAYASIRVDFWCATASQVGFFEEAKLFVLQKSEYCAGHPVPFPKSHLGVWWNVWDSNDFLSFTAKGIFDGVIDESYNSGMSLRSAHSGYLQRPSFYRRFAERLAEAKQKGWTT